MNECMVIVYVCDGTWSPGRGATEPATLNRGNPAVRRRGDASDRAKGRHLTNPSYKELPNGLLLYTANTGCRLYHTRRRHLRSQSAIQISHTTHMRSSRGLRVILTKLSRLRGSATV